MLKYVEKIPARPTSKAAGSVHCQAVTKYKTINPTDIVKTVLDGFVFVVFIYSLKKRINKRRNSAAAAEYDYQTKQKQYDNDWCEPVFLPFSHK